MDFGGAIPGEIEEFPVAYFEDALIDDILGGAGGMVRAGFFLRSASTHGMPKLNSLIRFGRKSTTCSFTSMTAASCCVAIIATDPQSWG